MAMSHENKFKERYFILAENQGSKYNFRSLSVSTDDDRTEHNDWGSDFEEISTPPSARNPKNEKVELKCCLYILCYYIQLRFP